MTRAEQHDRALYWLTHCYDPSEPDHQAQLQAFGTFLDDGRLACHVLGEYWRLDPAMRARLLVQEGQGAWVGLKAWLDVWFTEFYHPEHVARVLKRRRERQASLRDTQLDIRVTRIERLTGC
jgi:hypothetical protein